MTSESSCVSCSSCPTQSNSFFSGKNSFSNFNDYPIGSSFKSFFVTDALLENIVSFSGIVINHTLAVSKTLSSLALSFTFLSYFSLTVLSLLSAQHLFYFSSFSIFWYFAILCLSSCSVLSFLSLI